MTEEYKSLLTAIVLHAVRDYQNNPWERGFLLKFFHSPFCRNILEEIDIDFEAFISKLKKIS